jgi:hypothetical protein
MGYSTELGSIVVLGGCQWFFRFRSVQCCITRNHFLNLVLLTGGSEYRITAGMSSSEDVCPAFFECWQRQLTQTEKADPPSDDKRTPGCILYQKRFSGTLKSLALRLFNARHWKQTERWKAGGGNPNVGFSEVRASHAVRSLVCLGL